MTRNRKATIILMSAIAVISFGSFQETARAEENPIKAIIDGVKRAKAAKHAKKIAKRTPASALNDFKSIRSMPRIRAVSDINAETLKQLVADHKAIDTSTIINVVSILPTDQSTYKAMFNSDAFSASANNDMYRFAKSSAQFGDHAVLFTEKQASAAESFNSVFSKMENDVVVITGHSVMIDDGRHMVMPSGETIHFDRIRIIAQHYNKQAVLLTCHSNDLDLSRKISFKEASGWISNLQKLETDADYTRTAVFLEQNILEAKNRKERIAIAVMGAGIGGASSTFVSVDYETE